MSESAFQIRNLVVEIDAEDGVIHASRGVDLEVAPGETLGLVGESGCGKTVSLLAAVRLTSDPPVRVVAGDVRIGGHDIMQMPASEARRLLGREVGVVFQDPSTSLHPSFTVGDQIAEALRIHERRLGRRAARARVVDLLRTVGIPAPEHRIDEYPHQWSGGMRQRAVVAMAIANRPRVLIADEPTSALDVTVQAQVLELLAALRDETDAAMVFVSHDLAVVAGVADRVSVMYAGAVVESGPAEDLFENPSHPYTRGLLQSLPRGPEPPRPLAGRPPDLARLPMGCTFRPRCSWARGRPECADIEPALTLRGAVGRACACHAVPAHDEVGR